MTMNKAVLSEALRSTASKVQEVVGRMLKDHPERHKLKLVKATLADLALALEMEGNGPTIPIVEARRIVKARLSPAVLKGPADKVAAAVKAVLADLERGGGI